MSRACSRLWRRLAASDGIVALETILSSGLLLMLTLIVSGVAVVIYNQAVVQSGSQLAASEAAIAVDRYHNRLMSSAEAAQMIALAQANAAIVFNEVNYNLVKDKSGQAATGVSATVDVVCGPDYPSPSGSTNGLASSSCPGNLYTDQNRLVRIEVDGKATTGSWLASLTGSFFGSTFRQATEQVSGKGVAFSAGENRQ